jgi:hypothetical protein
MSKLLLVFCENYFGCSAEELARRIATEPAAVAAPAADFLNLLSEQLGDLRIAHQGNGELRPIVGGGIEDMASGGLYLRPSDLERTEAGASAFSLDVRSLLLYAHSVALPNPFRPSLLIADDGREIALRVSQPGDPNDFLFALALVTSLAPLLDDGVVHVFDPSPPPFEGLRLVTDLGDVVPDVALSLLRAGTLTFTDQTDLRSRARVLLERIIRQNVFVESAGGAANRLVSCEAERVAMQAIDGSTERPGDAWILDELLRLQLQAAGRIKLEDMVSIRSDENFAIFRRDMASAVKEVEATGSVDRAAAIAVIADEMRGSAKRLWLGTRRSQFFDATLGDAFSWIVGTTIGGALAGWPGALAGLAAKGVAEVVREGPSRSDQALRAHYIELSRGEESPKISARDRLLAEW